MVVECLKVPVLLASANGVCSAFFIIFPNWVCLRKGIYWSNQNSGLIQPGVC